MFYYFGFKMISWLLFVLILCFKPFEVNARDNVYQSKHLFNLSLYEEVINPELCEQQLKSISENALLAARFLDSGIRLPKGILQGNTYEMGNYYQCLGINEELSNTIIEGKYCMINIPLNDGSINSLSILDKGFNTYRNKETLRDTEKVLKMRKTIHALVGDVLDDRSESLEGLPGHLGLSVAVCIPKPCTAQHALELSFPINVTSLGFQFQEQFYRLPNDKQWVPADYVAIVIFSVLALLTLLSTAYDVYFTLILKNDLKTTSAISKTFSVYSNYTRLVTFTSNSNSLDCLDGIRAISMAWIVVGHTFMIAVSHPRMFNLIDVAQWMDSFASVWITSAPITVDTFFMLSGFLVVYTTAGKLSSKKLITNVHLFYLNRILRMYPILATALLLEASLSNRFYDGPYLEARAMSTINCRNNWWTVLLFTQNYVNPQEICLPHTWYLAIDMQLHIISPIVLFWVLYNRRTAWFAMSGALLTVTAAAAIYCFINKFPGALGAMSSTLEDTQTYLFNYYYNTLTRAAPFFVGMCFGYLVYTYRGRKLKISKVLLFLIWTSAAVISACIIAFHHFATLIDWDAQTINNLMNSFMRPVWALVIGWIIFACIHGFGGPLNSFLSLSIWKLPARISYAMYIIHYPLQFMGQAASVVPFYFSVQTAIFRSLSEYSLSFILAFLITLLIDAPFSSIFKIMLGGGAKKRKEPSKDSESQTEDDKRVNESECIANKNIALFKESYTKTA